jgi:hypothetical protein
MNFIKDNVAIKDFINYIKKKIYMDVSFVLRFKVKI